MPRRARIVLPNHPHHIVQRGVRRMDVFFQDSDYAKYLDIFSENAEKYGVLIIGYCLMTNHVHHILVPLEKDSLARTLQTTHQRYSIIINSREGWKGHLWQERYFSSPLDNDYFWSALRYVERNPVEARMGSHASDYKWSSAKAHCGLKDDLVLDQQSDLAKMITKKTDWYSWLEKKEDEAILKTIRDKTYRDLPTGGEEFIKVVERLTGIKIPKFARRTSC